MPSVLNNMADLLSLVKIPNSLSDSNEIRTYNHFVCKPILNQAAKLVVITKTSNFGLVLSKAFFDIQATK